MTSRLPEITAAALIAPFLLTGCSILDVNSGKGDPVPENLSPSEPKPSLTDPDAKDAGFKSAQDAIESSLRWRFEQSVIKQAKVDLPLSSSCTSNGNKDGEGKWTCTVTLAGQDIPYSAEVSNVSSMTMSGTGTGHWRFRIKEDPQDSYVITKQAVLLAMDAKRAEYSDIRCDADLPEVALVQKSSDLPDRYCYGKPSQNFTKKFGITGGVEGATTYVKS